LITKISTKMETSKVYMKNKLNNSETKDQKTNKA
jgi:hypothetical protein